MLLFNLLLPRSLAHALDAVAGTNGDKYIIVMVGLPARGKTYIARKLARYLLRYTVSSLPPHANMSYMNKYRYLEFFHDAPTKVFNVGNYRRDKFGK